MIYNTYRIDFATTGDRAYNDIQLFRYNGIYVDFINNQLYLVSDHILTINDLNRLSAFLNYDIIIDANSNVIFIYNDYIE
jgi:hypothetical protein